MHQGYRKTFFVSLILVAVRISSVSLGDLERFAYEDTVGPLFEKYCFTCHGPDEQESGVRIDTLNRDFVNGRDGETWHDMHDVLILGDMPPEEDDQPSNRERQLMIDWITAELEHATAVKRETGGRGVIRRLTRYEYNNTLIDLLGIELDYATDLPPETAPRGGFENDGSIMGMSGMQLEYYLKAARMGLDVALVYGPQPERFYHYGTCNVDRRWDAKVEKTHTNKIQPGNAFMTRMMDYPVKGPVTIRVKAHAVIPEGKGPPRMRVRVGIRADTYIPGGQIGEDIDVLDTEETPGVYEFRGQLDRFEKVLATPSNFPGLMITVQNVYDDGSDKIDVLDLRLNEQERQLNDPDPCQPWIVVESVEFIAPDYAVWPPEHHTRILFEGLNVPEEESAYAEEVLRRFMRRAYRRPATAEEIQQPLRFFEEIRREYETFTGAIKEALAMTLVSPQFLYLVEPTDENLGARKLTDFEVASRLSYFLWSTMPDEELLQIAEKGRLLKRRTLSKQVQRMLDHPKSERFVKRFTEQWLDLVALDRVAINPQFYPDFNERAIADMRRETEAFFEEILRNDLSALNFLDSDFSMLNERLAKHYGIDGVVGSSMQRAPLPADSKRGGLITQGSMLVGNSTGEDSHPINRAVWIMERILDDPPPPPPAMVPDLDPETPGFAEMPLKEQLAIHRQQESCNNCHKKIDPWGIPLEEFDATGLRRTKSLRLMAKEKGGARTEEFYAPGEISDVMPDGVEIQGAQSLKDYLLETRRRDFARAMVAKLTSYGLGRTLEFSDEPDIEQLADQFEKRDYRLDKLIESIVLSELFLTR
ncbi:MAG TPA: hypothetical protein DIV79_09845 [Opitutae bacterium]|nr:hypothetical protein [Opitutae bacterium]